jgi:hypothetical protein
VTFAEQWCIGSYAFQILADLISEDFVVFVQIKVPQIKYNLLAYGKLELLGLLEGQLAVVSNRDCKTPYLDSFFTRFSAVSRKNVQIAPSFEVIQKTVFGVRAR